MSGPRTVAIFAIGVLALSGCKPVSAHLADADRDAIHAAVENFTKAMVAGDFATAASYYTEDGMLMPPNAPIIQGRAAIQSFFTSYPKISAFKQDIVELDANGDLAYARIKYDLTTMPPGAKSPIHDTGKVIIIMRKQTTGTWLTSRGIFNSDLTGKTVIS